MKINKSKISSKNEEYQKLSLLSFISSKLILLGIYVAETHFSATSYSYFC